MTKQKIFIISIITLIAAYFIAWYSYSAYMKKFFISKAEKYIEYEDISIGTNPLKISLNIKNPKIKIDLKDYLEDDEYSNAILTSDISIDGNMKVTSNFLANKFAFIIEGNSLYNIDLDNQNYQMVDKTKKWIYKIAFHESILPQIIEDNISIEEIFQKDGAFKYLKISSDGNDTILENPKTGNKLFSSGDFKFKIYIKESKEKSDIKLYAKNENANITKEYFDFIENFLKNKIIQHYLGDNSKYFKNNGKFYNTKPTNIKLDIEGSFNKEVDNFKLDIKDFEFSDTTSEIEVKGKVKFKKSDNDTILVKLDIKSQAEYEPLYKEYILDAIHNDNELKQTKNLFLGEVSIDHLIPNLHEFGKIKLNINFDGNINEKEKQIDIKLKHYDLTSDLYGLKLKGEAKNKDANNIEGNFDLELINYKNLTNDVISYAKKILALMSNNEAKIDDSINQNLIELFEMAANEKSADNIKINIKLGNNPEKNSFGKMKFLEFVGQLFLITGFAQQPTPPATN